MKNKKVVLAKRPEGSPKESDFRIVEEDLPTLGKDQVLLEIEHLSIDAFIRTMLDGDAGFHGRLDFGTPVTALGIWLLLRSIRRSPSR